MFVQGPFDRSFRLCLAFSPKIGKLSSYNAQPQHSGRRHSLAERDDDRDTGDRATVIHGRAEVKIHYRRAAETLEGDPTRLNP